MTEKKLLQGDKNISEAGFDSSQSFIIAGPCSAETKKQVFETAHALKNSGIKYFRAGIWKPRTRPDSFAGAGDSALKWLRDAGKETGLKTATEVANARHVELALKNEINLLWLGARTTVNPFTVQEIADALKGVDIPVMVKNPINPDVELWAGAVERIMRADIQEIWVCHRGFNVYAKTLLRNMPLWEIPIEMKRRFPLLPMICDPSHISGKKEYIAYISQKALDLGYEGLMVETHPNPTQALSDAEQQLKPEELLAMLAKLHFRKQGSINPIYEERIRLHRNQIDEIDSHLVELLAERMDISKNIGALKKANNLPFYEYNRWSEVLEQARITAKKLGLKEEFVIRIFTLLHLESIEIQGE